MQKSDSIANLAAALSQVQGKLNGAVKDSVNPFFKSKYANLEGVWESIRAPMAEHGLSVSQLPGMLATGQPTLTTMLMHKSGEWISSEQALFPLKQEPQGIAAATTYARRSALSAIIGQVESEDDGETAQERPPVKELPHPKHVPKEQFKGGTPHVAQKISDAQRRLLFAVAGEHKVPDSVLKEICGKYGYTSRNDIMTTHFEDILEAVKAH